MPHFGKLFRKHDDYFIFCHFAFLLFGLKAYPAMHPMKNIGIPQLKNAPHIFASLLPVKFFPYCPRHAFVKIPVHIKPRSFLLPAFFPLPFLLPCRYIGDKLFPAYHGSPHIVPGAVIVFALPPGLQLKAFLVLYHCCHAPHQNQR